MGFETDLVKRCQREGTPLIEGNLAAFVWHGENPPRLMGDFNGWDEDQAIELQPVGEELWMYELPLPEDAYIEYTYLNEAHERVLDPFNRRKTPNGMGKTNQFFYMPEGKPSPWVLRRYGQPRGEVSQVVVEAGHMLAGGKRSVHFYQPPVDEPSPLVVVWDGGDYLRRAKLAVMLDNLIAERRIRPLALAMIENGGPARMMEYACGETTIGFLLSHLLPEAYNRLNLVDPDLEPGAFGVIGASMGGLMALYTGLRLPHLFGHVLAQSGGYELGGYEFITSFMIEHGPQAPLKIWMDVGRYEFLLAANRMMHEKLVQHGYEVDYHEYNAGHNYPAWRDDLPGGLEYLYGIMPW
jgi:enterochelin esterase-like enzyme